MKERKGYRQPSGRHSSNSHKVIKVAMIIPILLLTAIVTATTCTQAQTVITKVPEGTKIESIGIFPIIYTHLDGEWAYYNSSSHASGHTTFTPYETTHKFDKWGEGIYAFVANINNKTFGGSIDTDGANFIDLCHYNSEKCNRLQTRMDINGQFVGWGINHLELRDDHNHTVHLMRITS